MRIEDDHVETEHVQEHSLATRGPVEEEPALFLGGVEVDVLEQSRSSTASLGIPPRFLVLSLVVTIDLLELFIMLNFESRPVFFEDVDAI